MNIPFLFTYDAIITLTAIITSLLITGYVARLQNKTPSTRWFLGFFLGMALLAIGIFLESSLILWGDMFYAVQVTTAVATLLCLVQFVYSFPHSDQPREARLVLRISLVLLILIAGISIHYISLFFTDALLGPPPVVSLTILYLTIPVCFLSGTLIIVRRMLHYARQSLVPEQQHSPAAVARAVLHPASEEVAAMRAFALILLLTGIVPVLSTPLMASGVLAPPIAAYSATLGFVLFMLAIFLAYLNYSRESSNFTARVFSIALVLLLVIFGVIALITTTTRNEQFRQKRAWQVAMVQQAILRDDLAYLPTEVAYIAAVPASPPTSGAQPYYQRRYPLDGSFSVQFLATEDRLRQELGDAIMEKPGLRTLDYIRELTTLPGWHSMLRYGEQQAYTLPVYVGYRFADAGTRYEIGFRLADDLHYINQENLRIIALLGFSIVVLWLALKLFLYTSLVQPLNALLHGVRQANTGNLHVAIPVRYEDEIGFLTHAFNRMIATIAEATTRLEQRVEERTRDLEHTNAQLREEMQARERMAVALCESEEKYRNVSERANDGILIAQNELIKYCNTRLAEMLGYTVEELQETRFDRLIEPAYRTLVLERVRQRIQGAAVPSRYEIVALKRDGSALDVEINAGLMEYEGTIAVLAFVRDMTERKQAEQSLQRSEELYRLLTETMYDVVWKLDVAGTFTYVSPSVYHLRGYTPQEVMAEPMNAALTPDSLALVLEHVQQAHETGIYGVDRVELEQPCKDGSTVWTECVTTPLLDEQGTLTGWVGVSRDITERRRVEEELRQAKEVAESANRAKSAFLANMSHELRTPLNAILGFAQIMRSSHDLPREHGNHVAIIYRNGEHLLSLINNVLDLSKIEAGRMVLSETHFDLHRLLDDLEDTFRLRAHEKRLALHFACPPDVPRYGYADEVKLRQVLLNLLSNAIKFTSNGSVVLRVSATHHPPDEPACAPAPDKHTACCTLRFEVADTGTGMAAEELDHLFHPFVQARSGQQAHEGTGLGLAISRRFVEMMGGAISVSSSVNVGSTFTVTIPVAVGASHDVAPPAEAHRRVVRLAPTMPRYRVLVVDDRTESRLLLTSLLQPLGFGLREACNGQEAVAVWQVWEPHLILMDIRMPVMDGDAATRHIKATTTPGQAPIIVALTASAFEDERDAMLAAGCDDFLRKPFREHELLTLLQRHLGLHYEYVPASDTAQNHTEPGSVALTAALGTLPSSLVTDLELAAMRADMVRVDSLIDQIDTHHAPLAERLRSLARNFEYDQILTIIEKSR